jgi:cytochrome c peroxidase
MKRMLFTLAMAVAIGSLRFAVTANAQLLSPGREVARVKILTGPSLELAHDDLAVIRWTTSNSQGSDDHFGVVYYGTDAKNLGRKAQSHIRLNRAHPETIFRVRISGLQPGTTYYYQVGSIESDGESDGIASTIGRFTMPAHGERFLAYPAHPALRSEQAAARLAKAETSSPSAGKSPEPVYDPYPPGILPPDLKSETARVERETRRLYNQILAQWKTLPASSFNGNPPTAQNSGYRAVRTLGKLMNYDLNMSPFRNVSCSSCHMPYAGFSGPIPSVNLTIVAYPGTMRFRAAKRTAQRYTYSPRFPALQYNRTQQSFLGGNFWDARATGYRLQNPDADQAQHPPVDMLEMGFPDTACIAFRLSRAPYRKLFEQVWGAGSFSIRWPSNTERICNTPGGAKVFGGSATPIALSPENRTEANNIFNHWAQSISAFEDSPQVSPFSSKFDAFLAGKYTMTKDEMAGYQLFNGKGNCNSCHLDGVSTTLKSQQTDSGTPADVQPLFTCFGYANLGVPLNPRIALFYETTPDRFGFTPNPYGFSYRDLGLGNFLRSGYGSAPNPNSQWVKYARTSDGQMQTSTARDVAMTPLRCATTEAGQKDKTGRPIPYFQKEFFHNGYIKSLKQLVHFYNTRDVYRYHVTSGHCPAGTTEKVNCWPMPEVPNNIDMTVGNLGLTDHEEDQMVTFLETLTDGYTIPYPDRDSFTGQCMTGGSALTQGNESLIATPRLPSCAKAICAAAPLPGPQPIP